MMGREKAGRLLSWLFIGVWLGRAAFLSSAIRLSAPAAEEKIDQSQLPRILAEVASYCRKFVDASLYYVCLEEVTETIYSPYRIMPWSHDSPYRSQKNHWLYDYQLIQKKGDIKEQRILLEENGVILNVKEAPLQVRRFRYKHIIMGPLLLDEYWQEFHDYRIIGRERFKEEPCFVIEAVPKPGIKRDHLFGKFWVSERDNRVWRMEWNQESIDNYELIEETAKALNAQPQVKLILEMGFEEKGIRFPSRYIQREEFINKRGALLIVSEATVNYKDYKFFAVETEVQIKRRFPAPASAFSPSGSDP
jgi:hypothetical protein